MNRSSAIIDTICHWMRAAAESGEPVAADQVKNWCTALKCTHGDLVDRELAIAAATDGMAMQPTDRVNAVEAETMVYGAGKLIKFLAEHAAQAATLAELTEIDEAASAIIDLTEHLARGVARPTNPQTQTGA